LPPAPAPQDPDSLDIAALLAAAADDPEFVSAVSELAAAVANKMPRDVSDAILAVAPETWAARALDCLNGARG
jgi:hypothetical protein